MSHTVVVLGASANPERYSNLAVSKLLEHGYRVIPVNPAGGKIHGQTVVTSLTAITEPVHTLTVYVNPEISQKAAEAIIALQPQRIIFNPGTENQELEIRCRQHNIAIEKACTLVMLKTGIF